MFSLIITIISIALVAALALASIYYGGDAFTKGSDGAAAARLINEGQQLQGARTLVNAEGKLATVATVAGLATNNYLSQVPADWTTDATTPGNIDTGAFFTKPAGSASICNELNKKAGFTPAEVTAGVTALGTHVYGCITADNKVQYKY